MARPLRIVLDEAHFRRLVFGGVVGADAGDERVEIILSDIGWIPMMRAIFEAAAWGLPQGPPDPPQAREFLPNKYTRREE